MTTPPIDGKQRHRVISTDPTWDDAESDIDFTARGTRRKIVDVYTVDDEEEAVPAEAEPDALVDEGASREPRPGCQGVLQEQEGVPAGEVPSGPAAPSSEARAAPDAPPADVPAAGITPLPPVDFTKRYRSQPIDDEDGAGAGPGERKVNGHAGAHAAGDEPMEIPSGLGEWNGGEDVDPIPPRGWLLGNSLCRKFLSTLMAGGGTGKTALRIVQALAMATGRELTGEHVFQRSRVLFVSLEDDKDELRRRLRAAMTRHRIDPKDIDGWLYLATPAALGMKLASDEDREFKLGELGAKLEEAIELLGIDAVILDPFVKAHSVGENDNNRIDMVANILVDIAVRHDCAVDILHHVRKGPADPGNADSGRGAGALKDGGRLVYTLTTMSVEEARTFELREEERRLLVRLDSAKVNLARRSPRPSGSSLVGVALGNGTPDYPYGDDVQTVETWTPPSAWVGLSHTVLNEILSAIYKGLDDGNRYSDGSAAKDRAAWRVVIQHAPDRTEKDAREIIRTWVKNGVLVVEEYTDPVRHEPVKGLKVIDAKRPS